MYTILTIDDEENIRNGLADNFELEGYNVVTASNGKDGLDLGRVHKALEVHACRRRILRGNLFRDIHFWM